MSSDRENRLSISRAAELMGVSAQFIRIGIRQGLFPWGYAVRISGGRYTYFISKNKFAEETGIIPD